MPVSALFDSSTEFNTIYLTFATKLSLLIIRIDIEAQKIDSTTLDTYEILVVVFSVTDKANQVRFFEETFLVANVSPKVNLEMLFFTLSGADVNFLDWELQ